MKYILTLGILVLSSCFVLGQIPGKKQDQSILLKNAVLHIGNGKQIDKAYIGFEEGLITLVKDMLTNTINEQDFDTIIDVKGQHVYPGFINLNNTLGITEIDAIRSTRDYSEVGLFKPNVRSQIAFNTESIVVSTVRTNGVLITQATPRRGLISGTSSLINLDGWNWEDATLKQDDGIHLNWSHMDEHPSEQTKHLKNYETQLEQIHSYFQKAESFYLASIKDEANLSMIAMQGIFDGSKRLYIHADKAKQILDVLAFCKKFNIKYPVIVGGRESYKVTHELKAMKIPLIIGRIHTLPSSEDASVNESFELPKKLMDAGVLFGIQNSGEMEAMNSRNLPFNAGTARAFGLTDGEAVQAITLNNAIITGTDDLIGSVEVGKQATLFVSRGDALDQLTNNVTLAFIQGRQLDLDNHQKQLYKKYGDKLGIEVKQ
jgi:imidazolonepropionase-like amidohydrolase